MNISPVSFSGLHISDDKDTRRVLRNIIENEEIAKDAANCFSAIDKNAGGEDVFLSAKNAEYKDRITEHNYNNFQYQYAVTIKDVNGRELNKAVFAKAKDGLSQGWHPELTEDEDHACKEHAAKSVQDGFAALAKTDIPQSIPPYLRKIFDTFK